MRPIFLVAFVLAMFSPDLGEAARGSPQSRIERKRTGLFTSTERASRPLRYRAESRTEPAIESAVSAAIAGDVDGNGCVDNNDYLLLKSRFGQAVSPGTGGDGNNNGIIDSGDYTVWRDNLGSGDCSGQSASAVPIPYLDQWRSQMISYGDTHCKKLRDRSLNFDAKLAATYYDAEWVFYQIGDYTKDNKWYQCAQDAEAVYRSQYVVPNNGTVPGYWNFSHGLHRDFLSTGDASSKSALIMLAENASYAPDTTPLSWTADASMSREVAYALMSYLNAESIGEPARQRRDLLLNQAFGHLDQWFGSQSAEYVRPFMFSLTAQALITYHDQVGTNQARILDELKRGADWIWSRTWLPQADAFKYTDRNVESGGTEPAPDLNLLVAPVFAWLWHQTGDPIYRERADLIFAGGVKNAWLVNGKQFNQNYRWSFDFIKWRSMPPIAH